MKKIKILLLFLFLVNSIHAQNPLVKQWDKRFGGTGDDGFHSLVNTCDHGFIIGGHSGSGINGDKTQSNRGIRDYWVVKTDSLGNKQWDKRFGGTDIDEIWSICPTFDGGFMLGGRSNSDSVGDKTQPCWDSSWFGIKGSDYWTVMIDSNGNKLWDKRFGGIGEDQLFVVQQTVDGGFILGGHSMSGATGDKSQSNWDSIGVVTPDYWVVKINSLGIKQWDKRFGTGGDDYFASIIQSSDGGYLLGGFTSSGINGDKTEPNWDTSDSTADYWVVKIDSIGNKQWDKRYGGTGHDGLTTLLADNDGGYILGGVSNSNISGDKTQPAWATSFDYWFVKIDALGVKQWDKCFGGTNDEDFVHNIVRTCDNGFLISGLSYSQTSGNKTEDNLGIEQTWIVKTDSLFNLQWDKTIFTVGHDEMTYAVQTKSGCYVMGNWTEAGTGGYKTQPSWGFKDYWIVKLCDTSLAAVGCPKVPDCNISSYTSENSFQFHITAYPNPFVENITIDIHKQNLRQVSFAIKNILGKTIISKQEKDLSGAYSTQMDLNSLSKGFYLLDIYIDGERTIKKIVKE